MTRTDADYRNISYWHASMPEGSWTPRPGLTGSTQADVAIVGAGYTGLWTAYWLKRAEPDIRITIVESEVSGYGASGRNGGWASAFYPASMRRLAAISDEEGAIRTQRQLNALPITLGKTLRMLQVESDYARDGNITLARNPAQVVRAAASTAQWHHWGFPEQEEWWEPAQTAKHLGVGPHLGATWTQYCASVHPAKLVHGLARAVEEMGVQIVEQTPVRQIAPGVLHTDAGTIQAEHIIRATEAYTVNLPGQRRSLIPMLSLMIATEPLPLEVQQQLFRQGRPTFADHRHMRIYGQLTADGRIALGGRGAPYHYGSRIESRYEQADRVHQKLAHILFELFPDLPAQTQITHRWGGVFAIPRDWTPGIVYDRTTGLGATGGYLGDGVTTSFLAGRTFADLITGADTVRTHLPWVQHRSRRWEPEPLRWLGVNGVSQLFSWADRSEARTGKPAAIMDRFWGWLGQ